MPVLEDYYEYGPLPALHILSVPRLTTSAPFRCLHHKKEGLKILALQHAYRKREAESTRDNAPNAGEIRSLGLLKKPAEEVNVKKSSVIPSLEDNMPRPAGQKPIVP